MTITAAAPSPPARRGTAALVAHLSVLTVTMVVLSAGCGHDTPVLPPVPVPATDAARSLNHPTLEAFQAIALPVADQGPHHRSGPVVAGFEHSPAGAALAAMHATVRMSVSTDDQWPVVGQQMLAPGPGRDAWAIARAQVSITSAPTSAPPIILGYLICDYTPTAADIAIYTRQSDRSITRNAARVVWQSQDWKLLIPPQPHPALVTVADTVPPDLITVPSP